MSLLLFRFVVGRQAPGQDGNRWLMAVIIYQIDIDKKRKKCLKTIYLLDAYSKATVVAQLSIRRLNG